MLKKKKKNQFGTFYQMSPGNIEYNIDKFNNSVRSDVNIGELCTEDLELKEDQQPLRLTPQERLELKNLVSTTNDYDTIVSYINTKLTKNENLNEDLFDDIPMVEIEPITQDEIELPGPQTESEFGDFSLISDAVQNCWAMIDNYNSIISTSQTDSIKELAKELVDIELLNVGRLEEVLKEVSPNAENLEVEEVNLEEV